jgi:hypothetical protein
MIELNFEFTKQELVEAQRANPMVRVLFIVLAAVFLWLGWTAYRTFSEALSTAATQPSRTINLAEAVVAALPFIVWSPVYVWLLALIRRRMKRQITNRMFSGPRRMIFDDSGVRTVHALADTFYRWEAIEEVVATKNLYLLNIGAVALIVPKRPLAPDQRAEFEYLLRSRVMERTGGFPLRATPPPLPASNIQPRQA